MKSKKKSPKPRIYKKRGGKEIDYDLDGPLDTYREIKINL